MASTHQKHPAPKIAVSVFIDLTALEFELAGWAELSAWGLLCPHAYKANKRKRGSARSCWILIAIRTILRKNLLFLGLNFYCELGHDSSPRRLID